jgi:hypothetical protein
MIPKAGSRSERKGIEPSKQRGKGGKVAGASKEWNSAPCAVRSDPLGVSVKQCAGRVTRNLL